MNVNERVEVNQKVKVPWGKETVDGVIVGVLGRIGSKTRNIQVYVPSKDSTTKFRYYNVDTGKEWKNEM